MENAITGEQIKEAVKKHRIVSWSPRSCSICESKLHYYFYNAGDTVLFDSSCDCVIVGSDPELRSYDDIAEIYNNGDEETRTAMEEHFHLKQDDSLKDIADMMSKITLKFTPEYLAEASMNAYKDDREYPENFSNWWYHIIDFGKFKHADIISNQILSFDEVQRFQKTDNYNNVNWEDINEILKPTLSKMKPMRCYNIKNGCFSNKFDFETSIADTTNLAQQFWKINYAASMFGAGGNTELVVREIIPHSYKDDVATIYNGMPLREEVRVFYNLDTKQVEYMVDYWDYDYCADKLTNISDRIVFNWFHNKYGDRQTNHIKQLEILFERIEAMLPDLKFDDQLNGIWSIDFLWESYTDEIYLIDMARGYRSAYWDPDTIMS